LIELHVILRHKGDGTTRPTSARSSAHPSKHHKLALSIEKGEAVLYRDFVTILRGESLEYITKLATPQSQKPSVPPPPNYNVMCFIDALAWPVKISPVYKILLAGPWVKCTAL
jgi:hypothetical protein